MKNLIFYFRHIHLTESKDIKNKKRTIQSIYRLLYLVQKEVVMRILKGEI